MAARPGRLMFKGSSKPVGSTSGGGSSSGGSSSKPKGEKRKADSDGSNDIWVKVESLADFSGPLFIVAGGSKCILSTDHHELKLTAAPKTPEGKIEPDVVGQVFIAQQATSTPGVVSLKTPFGRFVSADKFGIVSANREAVGPQEEWTVILREDGVAFQSQFDKFLAFEDERNTLRADSESVGFAETFLVKCQFERRQDRKKKQKDQQEKNAKDLELETVKKFQTWGAGRVKMSQQDEAALLQAKAEGKLNESLLDRREKMKADKFCK